MKNIYSNIFKVNNKNLSKAINYLIKKELVGVAGTVYFWTSTTLHGTRPQTINDDFRISLRYLIKKKTSHKVPIDDLIKEKTIIKTRYSKKEREIKILK